MPDFTIDSITVCDYATQDTQGKAVIVGAYTGEIRFSETPQFWNPLYFIAVIDPIAANFEFDIEFLDPKEQPVCGIKGKYSADRTPPAQNRAMINWQMPPLPFTGTGQYSIRAKDAHGAVIFDHKLWVSTNEETENFDAKIEAQILIRVPTTEPN